MTGPIGQPAPAEDAAPVAPRIVITFGGPGQAAMDIRPEGPLSVAQVYGAAWLLEAWARETRTRELMQSSGGVMPAGGDLPSLLRSLGLGV